MKKETKAIIFDIGGVLCKRNIHKFSNKFNKLAKLYNLDPAKFRKLRIKYSKQALIGKISAAKFKSLVLKKLRIRNKKQFKKKWDKIITYELQTDKRTENIIRTLKKNYTLGTLTNVTEMMDIPRMEKGIYEHFSINLKSYKENLKKPHKKFYKLLIKKLNLKPEQILFIDDDKENILAAKKLKIKTILFRSSSHLYEELRLKGVNIS